jgi:hypothetical protein
MGFLEGKANGLGRCFGLNCVGLNNVELEVSSSVCAMISCCAPFSSPAGSSSFPYFKLFPCSWAWTVCLCCLRLSNLENFLVQCTHSKGRSPVCFRICLAKCSDLVKVILQSGYPEHWNVLPLDFFLVDVAVGIDEVMFAELISKSSKKPTVCSWGRAWYMAVCQLRWQTITLVVDLIGQPLG